MSDKVKIEQEADKMATRQYIAAGYFGGRTKNDGGKVSSPKYFDYQGARQKAFKELERGSTV